MASAEVGNLYLLSVVTSVLHHSEPPIRSGRNPERIKNRKEFLQLSEELLQEHGLAELPQWPHLDKLSEPIGIDLGGRTVSVRVAHFGYYESSGVLQSGETSIIATDEDEPDNPRDLFKILQRFATWERREPSRIYLTRVSNHLGKVASDAELSSVVGSLR